MVAITPFLTDRFPVVTMIASASLTERFVAWLVQLWQNFIEWAAQPRQSYSPRRPPLITQVLPNVKLGMTRTNEGASADVVAAALAWLITFYVVCIIILGLGFGPAGVVAGMRLPLLTVKLCHADHGSDAGSLAAGFQAYMYGGFTPAGGIFATLTSMAMLGLLMPAVVILAVVLATGVAIIVWVNGVGG